MEYDDNSLHQDTSFKDGSGDHPPGLTSSNGSLYPATSEIAHFEDVGEDTPSSSDLVDASRHALRDVGDSGPSPKTAHDALDDRESLLPSPDMAAAIGRSDGGEFTRRDASVKRPTPVFTAKKHESFYFRDKMVFFLVEDTVFKVHSFFFERDSEYFRTMFRLHVTSSESRPIVLDVSIASFESFLGVLYPVHFARHVATTANEWIAILALATEWSFATIRTLAMRELFPLASPIDKVIVGIRYDMKEWLNDAYIAICERPEALTRQEGERLGLDEVIKISKMRQDARIGHRLLARCELGAMVRQNCCEITDGRDMPDIVDGGSDIPPPELHALEGSAIRGSSVATTEPNDTDTVPQDSNSLITLNTAFVANPPTSADSPPQMSFNAGPIPTPSQTLVNFQRFSADCFRFSAGMPPVTIYNPERKRQLLATMLLEWERLRVGSEVFDLHRTIQVGHASIKENLDMFEQRLRRSEKTSSSALHSLYHRLVLLGQEIIRVQREQSGCAV